MHASPAPADDSAIAAPPGRLRVVDADAGPVAPRGGPAPSALLRRRSATVCVDPAGRVLLYRRAERARAYPGWFDVLAGAGVRSGECRRAVESAFPGADLAEWYRRADDPSGAGLLVVHRLLTDRPPRPDPREVAWCGFVEPAELLAGSHRPLVPAGLDAVRRLFPTG
ncbi:NUDIX hydrolase [Streptomyces sp. TLI_171]|uniref:NUDIX hydrolase n=1 Tax=Streptomyces sp. TLI_171 TaxID=1938859 RepID=UPI000C17E398|nr:NUDIX hydrolase [Streptomyces sp. TLI_171]RKE18383.1 hypothetical protein BX266_1673 [Streptomyces sp. TLI_171]